MSAMRAPRLHGDAIPSELRGLPQWVCWRLEHRRDKLTKVPISPYTGTEASSTDPATWSTYPIALAARAHYRLSGVGFVFSAADPYTGVDLDGCRDRATGRVSREAEHIIRDLDSYTEVSVSGTGVHIILRGTLPAGGRRRGAVEMYDQGRYFCMTGVHLTVTPHSICDRGTHLAMLHRRLFPARATTPRTASAPAIRDDAALIKRAQSASNGDRFSALWEGRWNAYPSQSEADAALCAMLAFWTDGDAGRVDRLFRQSGLYRPHKWNHRHASDGRTYGQLTIGKVL